MDTGLQENLLDAMSILAGNAAEGTNTDKTIECEICAIQDASKGKYTVRYTENKFTAHSANGVTYAVGDSVYVLVPQGDFSKNKVILGSTIPTVVKGKQSGEGEEEEEEKVIQNKEYYDEISDNLLVDINDVELCTYHTETRELEYDSHYLSDIIKNYQYFVLKADFRTEIVDIAQRMSGNYGLRLRVPALKDGEEIVVEKVLDITKMDGNVYNFEKFATQRLYFDFDGSTIDPERQITISAFVKDFMQSEDDTIPPDIFIKDINFKAVNALTNEDLQGYFLTIDVSEGYYFLDGKYTNNKILTPKLRINGVFADIRDYECYWFKEDASIGVDSEGYNYRGGAGWRILNTGTKIGTNDDGTSIYDYNYKEYNYTVKKSDIISSARYKCVLLNSNIQTHGIVAIVNLNSEITYSLNTISGSTTFVKDVGVVNLVAKLHYPNAIDNTIFNYLFSRYDKNGNYLDSEFYDIVEWDAVDGVNRTTQISFPVGNIDEFNIVKCEFVRTRVQNNDIITDSIGTSSITLTTGTNVFDYFLSLENNEYYYKYDANGNSPKVGSFDGPYESKIQEVKPINVKVFKANGDELSTSEYNAVDMTWSFPKNSMMDLLGYDLNQLEQDDKYYYIKGKNIMSLSYDIKNIYNNEKFDNTILITAVFDDTTLKATADFTFKKDGESGTNGSKYSIVIKHEITDEDGIDRWYAYGERNSKGLPQKIRPVYVIDTWKRYLNNQYIDFGSPRFKVEVYKNGKLLENTPNQEDIYSVSWEMFDHNYTEPCFGISNGVLSVSEDWNDDEDIPVNIIKASVVIKESSDQTTGKEYVYGFYPIDIIRLDSNQKFIPEIAGGYSEVTYDSDGTNPKNNTNESFSVNVVDGLNNFYDCTWDKSDTLILEGKEADYAGLPFERDYRPISQLVDGQSKNYIKTILAQPAEKGAEVDAEAARLTQERIDINNRILYYTHEEDYLNTFLGYFSYDSFVNRLNSCENYLTYRGRYLTNLFDLVRIIDEIKNTDPEFDYSEQKEAINTIIQDIYTAESENDIVSYTDKIEIVGVINQALIGLINSFNENVDEGIRNYNNLIIYNNLATELNAYNLIVNNIKALPTHMTDLCSAHDEGEANEEFIKLREQISIYGNYFDDTSKGYTKKWIIDNVFKAIEELLATYKNSTYINNKYQHIINGLNVELAQVDALKAAADQSHFSHAIVVKPIIFLLNRYGLAAINNWDGNKLYTGQNDEYLFAPQIGAGKKENGQFTGVVMGIRVKGGTRKEIGLIGKHQGQDSFFLDAETGNADFGVAGEGQIQMRPGGTSTIAQWRINNASLTKSIGTTIVGLYSSADGRIESGKSVAFYAGDSSTSKRVYITYDGYLYANNANISGTITAHDGDIGGWIINSSGLTGGTSSVYIRAGKTSADDDSTTGFFLSQNTFSIGNSTTYFKYSYGNLNIANSSLGLTLDNNQFLVGNTSGSYMQYTPGGGLKINGMITATSGKIGPFNVNANYIWTEYTVSGVNKRNFILGQKGLCLGGDGSFYLGDQYINQNAIEIQDYAYLGGTIIHHNGGIQTDYLTIMNNTTIDPSHPLPISTTKGIYMNLSQGQYASDTASGEKYPLQLRFIGCAQDNTIVKGSLIGLWSEGRLIIGTKDYGFSEVDPNTQAASSSYLAKKVAVDGGLYVNRYIYCSFGEGRESSVPEDKKYYVLRRKTLTGSDGNQYSFIIAEFDGFYGVSEGSDPVTPGGNTGGTVTSESDVIVIPSSILNN